MKITIQIRVESDEGQLEVVQQLAHLDRGILRPETLGLSLAEAQSILAGIEQTVVEQQTAEFIALQRTCSQCVMPPFTLPQIGMPFAPRALRTPLIDQLASEPDSVDPAAVGPELLAAVRAGGGHDLLPFAGQSAALVRDVVPAAQLVERLVVETAQALERAHAAILRDSYKPGAAKVTASLVATSVSSVPVTPGSR